VNRFFLYIESSLWMYVTQTGGVMDSRAACSLWTAIRWPSCCITEIGRNTDREWKRSGGHPSKLTNMRSLILSLSRACADLQFAFTVQSSARFCVDPENKQYNGGEGDLFALTLLAMVRSSASKRKRNREGRIEEKICSSHVHSSLFLQYTYI
jgi:hypothetical protein